MPKSWDLQSIIFNAQQIVQAGRGIGRFSFSVKDCWPAPLNSVVHNINYKLKERNKGERYINIGCSSFA